MHPMEAKQKLAHRLTAQFHGAAAADEAQQQFNQVFRKREAPSEAPEFRVPASLIRDSQVPLVALLVEAGLAPSKSQAKRLILQGGVEINGERLTDPEISVGISSGTLVRVGKRQFIKLVL